MLIHLTDKNIKTATSLTDPVSISQRQGPIRKKSMLTRGMTMSSIPLADEDVISRLQNILIQLCDAYEKNNSYFACQILSILSVSFTVITYNLFFIIEKLLGVGYSEIHISFKHFACIFGFQIVANLASMFFIVLPCSSASKEV